MSKQNKIKKGVWFVIKMPLALLNKVFNSHLKYFSLKGNSYHINAECKIGSDRKQLSLYVVALTIVFAM